MSDRARVRLLDEIGANATAARTVQVLDGWWLRCAPDLPFRRSNSVVPLPGWGEPSLAVDERIDVVEDFYRRRGLPPRFQVSPSSEPDDLDERLERRGYTVDAPVEILVGEAADVLALLEPAPHVTTQVADRIGERWVGAYSTSFGDDERSRDRLSAYATLLRDIGPRSVAVLAELDDEPAAVGMGVAERGWLGIFGLATRSGSRGRGAARSVVGALARAGLDRSCPQLYVQVEVDNEAAGQLYRRGGFTASHGYHYRVLGASP